MFTTRRLLISILLIALAVRVTWALMQPSSDDAINRLPDQREYLCLAQGLLDSHTLGFVDLRLNQPVYAYRMPGYPAFIALCGASPRLTWIAQAFVDTGTILAIFLLARQLSGNEKLAFLAAAVTAINPFLIYFCGLLLTETLFTACLAWATLLLFRRRLLSASAILLFAIYIRPSAMALAPLLAGVAMLVNRRQSQPYPLLPALRKGIVLAVLVSGIMFMGLAPWAFRNLRILNSWVWTTTNAGITLYDGFHDGATGASDQRFLADMTQLRSMNEVERSRFLEEAAKRWAIDHKARLPGLTLKKIARTWSPRPLSDEFARPAYLLISALYAIPLDVLVVIGLFSRQLSRAAKALMMTPAIYFTIVHAMSVGSLRYRIPVEPELAVLAAAGAIAIATRVLGNQRQCNSHPQCKT